MTALVVTGFIRQARYLAGLLNTHIPNVHATLYDDRRSSLVRAAARALRTDAVVNFGGLEPKPLLRAICEARGRPAIHIWAGTDVLQAAHAAVHIERLRLLPIVHWAVSPQLVSELAELGIDAQCVTLASAPVPDMLAPLPERFTVLTYLPQPRRDFYGQQAIWQAARAMPDTRFIAIGHGTSDTAAPRNVEYTGEVSGIEHFIDKATVLVRMTQHDGLSQNIVEALARGRHVVWTYPYPGALHVRSANELIQELQRLRQSHDSGYLQVNHTGAEFAAAHHNPPVVARAVYAGITREIERLRSKKCHPGMKTIAISGVPAFSARVAFNCRSYNSELVPKLLTTHTNSDTAVSFITLLRSNVWYSIGEPGGSIPLELAALASGKRRIVHWLGNDVQVLSDSPRLLRRYRSMRFVHFAQDDDVARSLRGLGLRCSVASLPALPSVGSIKPLPERFTLLLYVPAENPHLYGRYQYERLMRALIGENVQYIIVGGGAIEIPSGVFAEQLGWVGDLGSAFERCTALVRFTQTDSFSAMVIEALLRGRYVFWSNEFPFTLRLQDYHDLESGVRSLLTRHQQGILAPQTDAAAIMRPLYSPETCLRSLADACS